MARKGFTEEQIGVALRQADAGTPVGEICRRLGISEPTFYAGSGSSPAWGSARSVVSNSSRTRIAGSNRSSRT